MKKTNPNKPPVIFLDIDGVLVNREVMYEEGYDWEDHHHAFGPIAISMLEKIVETTGAKIVISSVWRYGKTLDELKAIFAKRNFKYIDSIIEVTPRLYISEWKNPDRKDSCIRGIEIRTWLHDNDYIYEFPLQPNNFKDLAYFNRFVIIDDDSDMLLWQKDNFVHTDSEIGLTEEKANEAITIIRERTNI